MNQSLTEFRENYLERLLSFLWRQWSALGVAGYGTSDDQWFIDPEALLLFTCHLGRYDARLFDEVLDWLNTNGNSINIQRLRNILHSENFTDKKVLTAIADFMSRQHKLLKWRRLKNVDNMGASKSEESLFFLKDGKPMEQFGKPEAMFQKHGFYRGEINLRKHTQPVRVIYNTGFLFKLRALFGINARCEIIAYLLTHESVHPSLIARETYYSQKTVQDTLVEMTQSDLVHIRPIGKEKHYWVNKEVWLSFLGHQDKQIQWINWPSLLSSLEQIWLKLNQDKFLGLDSLVQSSELRALMQKVRPKIESAGFANAISNDRLYLGESYLSIFLSDVEKILG